MVRLRRAWPWLDFPSWFRWFSARGSARGRAGLGERGERLAEGHLRRSGYRIVGRRVRNAFGELDLVAIAGRTVVFVEVKTRERGDPEEGLANVLSDEQQRRITRAAYAFRKRHGLLAVPARFDLIRIEWPSGEPPRLRHDLGALDATRLDDGILG